VLTPLERWPGMRAARRPLRCRETGCPPPGNEPQVSSCARSTRICPAPVTCMDALAGPGRGDLRVCPSSATHCGRSAESAGRMRRSPEGVEPTDANIQLRPAPDPMADALGRLPEDHPRAIGGATSPPGQAAGEPACRPGSVHPPKRADGHPSRAAVADNLMRSTREHRAGHPQTLAQSPPRPENRGGSLLTLLRVGFT
jgi:hypothetical protein